MATQRERFEVLSRLERAGITGSDANALRRIALTLHRWHERECGFDTGCIERDDQTQRPYWLNSFTMQRTPIPDREGGALRRLTALMKTYRRRFHAYVQGDPRGAALYLVRRKDVPKGERLHGYYTRGIAIY